jgi:hypothetical protein
MLGSSPASDTDSAAASSLPGSGACKTGAAGKRGKRTGRNEQTIPTEPPEQDEQSERIERGEQTEHFQPAEQVALPADLTAFWKGNPEPGEAPEALPVPEMLPASTLRDAAATLPRQLGNFPFWQGGEPLLAVLEPLYRQVVEAGLALILGGEKEQSSSNTVQHPLR